MMTLRPTDHADFRNIDATGFEEELVGICEFVDNLPNRDEFISKFMRTMEFDDDVMAILGIFPSHPGTARAMAIVTKRVIEKHALSLHRSAKSLLLEAEESFKFFRVEATVRDDFEVGMEWVEALGFSHEGRMKNYGVGGSPDHHLYARTR